MSLRKTNQRARIDAIIEGARVPLSCEQMAALIFMDVGSVKWYVRHLLASGSLIIDHKVRKRVFYKSTGMYNPPKRQESYLTRDISVRREIKTSFVPARDEWTSLFFGLASKL